MMAWGYFVAPQLSALSDTTSVTMTTFAMEVISKVPAGLEASSRWMSCEAWSVLSTSLSVTSIYQAHRRRISININLCQLHRTTTAARLHHSTNMANANEDVDWDEWLDPAAYANEDVDTVDKHSIAPVAADEPSIASINDADKPSTASLNDAEDRQQEARSDHTIHDSSSSVDQESSHSASDNDSSDEDDESFQPPGMDQPGFVPIGVVGVASAAQGNNKDLEKSIKSRIVKAERGHDPQLTYRQIHEKYHEWGVTVSRLRGMLRNTTLARKDRERVVVWTFDSVSSLTLFHFQCRNTDLGTGQSAEGRGGRQHQRRQDSMEWC